jgi:hypothetical protein
MEVAFKVKICGTKKENSSELIFFVSTPASISPVISRGDGPRSAKRIKIIGNLRKNPPNNTLREGEML